ncbi:hypothetical protein pb186bvf_007841 [Paramecium bursaria]
MFHLTTFKVRINQQIYIYIKPIYSLRWSQNKYKDTGSRIFDTFVRNSTQKNQKHKMLNDVSIKRGRGYVQQVIYLTTFYRIKSKNNEFRYNEGEQDLRIYNQQLLLFRNSKTTNSNTTKENKMEDINYNQYVTRINNENQDDKIQMIRDKQKSRQKQIKRQYKQPLLTQFRKYQNIFQINYIQILYQYQLSYNILLIKIISQ